MPALLCVDVGSTWTKAALVGDDGSLVGTAQHPTTPPEVLHGIGAVTDELRAGGARLLACSSAGGGLRLAVVGQEPLVSAEAGYRVALSAGARVVHVHAGALGAPQLRGLRASRPDIVLLVGGTDGGDSRTLLHNAARLAVSRIAVPIVLAGNAAVRADAVALLRSTNRTVVVSDNVLPDVGELNPGPAREAIRAVFLRHVIGGKGLSRGPRFRRLVRMVTPDAVLVGVARLAEVLARSAQARGTEHAGSVLVVDVGGATTDVYSAVVADGPGDGGVAGDGGVVADGGVAGERHAVALPPQRRTVEGDLGVRASAAGLVAGAVAERLTPDDPSLRAAAARRAADQRWVPESPTDAATDATLARLAAVLAIRRHLLMIENRLGPRGAGLLVLSGGVFRHADGPTIGSTVAALREDPVLRPVLRQTTVMVDGDYVLAPAGMLAEAGYQAAADALVGRLVGDAAASTIR